MYRYIYRYTWYSIPGTWYQVSGITFGDWRRIHRVRFPRIYIIHDFMYTRSPVRRPYTNKVIHYSIAGITNQVAYSSLQYSDERDDDAAYYCIYCTVGARILRMKATSTERVLYCTDE